MNKLGFVAIALLITLGAGTASAVEVGDQALDFEFEKSWNTPEGATTLNDYRGKVVLLEWWATW